MSVARTIQRLPLPLRTHFVRAMYLRSGRYLEDLREFHGGRFYAYKVGGVYVPSESLGWCVDLPYYEHRIRSITAYGYQPRPGDVVVDVGAGIGEEAVVLSRMVGPTGKVVCIEANPEAFEVLAKVIELNALRNVEAFNIAINPSNEPVEMAVEEGTFLGGSLAAGAVEARTFTVPGKRFDTFLGEQGIRSIDLLKANIEGAERFLLETVGRRINEVRHVAISCHDFRYRAEGNPFFRTKNLVRRYLASNGFDVFQQECGVEYLDDWVYGVRPAGTSHG